MKKERWIGGPDLPYKLYTFYPYYMGIATCNRTTVVLAGFIEKPPSFKTIIVAYDFEINQWKTITETPKSDYGRRPFFLQNKQGEK